MTTSNATADRLSHSVRAARLAPAPGAVRAAAPAVSRTRTESLELRALLEANLEALQTLHDEHRRMIDTSLRAIDTLCTDLRAELRAIGHVRSPWVRALADTRALLFVALRELIVGAHEAELSTHLPQLADGTDADGR